MWKLVVILVVIKLYAQLEIYTHTHTTCQETFTNYKGLIASKITASHQ